MTILNSMPAPTWNRLKLNDITVELPAFTGTPEPCGDSAITSLGGEFCALVGNVTRFTEDTKLDLALKNGDTCGVLLHADKGAELTALMYVTSDGTAALRTFAEVSDNAKIRLVQIIEGGNVLNDVGASVGDSGKFEITQIFVGGSTVTGVCTALTGYKAELDCKLGYMLGGGEMLDINNVVLHKGRKTNSATNVKGVLSGDAHKTFRGTIDFRRGAAGAVGAETEDVLLMNEKVENKTVPVILCEEEDVEGSHGASIGRLSDEILYYMTSRGIPLEKAYKIMAQARIESLINGIGDETFTQRASEAVTRRNADV